MAAADMSMRAPTVYEPSVTGLPPLIEYFRSVWARRPLIWNLARTDLKAEHYGTVLGQVWILLDPLLMAAVYYMLRTVVRPVGNGNPALRNQLLAHLMWGLFFFRYTLGCFGNGARSVVMGKQLILNTSFPRMVFPITAVLKGILDFLPTLVVYAIFHMVLRQPVTSALLFIPLLVALQTVFNFGVALIFAPMSVFFRDTIGFIPYLSQIWLYMTPVLYRVVEIPPNLRAFLRLNPLYPLFAALEQIFTGHWPSFGYVAGIGAWAGAVLVVGIVVFLARDREFAIRF
jgi:teichoic acid transport system permease protein